MAVNRTFYTGGGSGSGEGTAFQVPTEFKGVLERYFKAVEEQQKNQ